MGGGGPIAGKLVIRVLFFFIISVYIPIPMSEIFIQFMFKPS